MRRLKSHFGRVAMLQTSLLFLHTAEADKEYNGELEFRSMKLSEYHLNSATVATICLLINILGLIGNGIVLCLFCCTTKKTKFTVYASNLAVADFIVLLRSFLFLVHNFITTPVHRHIRHLEVLLFFFSYNTNSRFLTVISTERYLTVLSPGWYQSHCPKYSTAPLCVTVWVVSVTLSMLNYFLCSLKYTSPLNVSIFPCKVERVLQNIVAYMILTPIMVLSTVALFIRLKRKPQENLPTRLDISILATVILHLTFAESTEIVLIIIFYWSYSWPTPVFYYSLIFYQVTSSVNPFVYLLVGCWKRGETQEPFYMFLERALRDESDSGSLTTQPPQEQA